MCVPQTFSVRLFAYGMSAVGELADCFAPEDSLPILGQGESSDSAGAVRPCNVGAQGIIRCLSHTLVGQQSRLTGFSALGLSS